MLHHHVVEVSMESTSVYWIPIWRVLSPYFKLNLANPYFIKQLPCRKSDVKDAQWIAECTMKELIRGSFVPPETIQQLRQYDRRIFDLNEEIVRKLSKLDAVLQRCNIRLSNYVSNVDSKSYKAVVRAISQGIIRNGQPPRFMERSKTEKRRIQQENKVKEHHSRKCISPQDNHRVCMGSQLDEGLLLQLVLVLSDASEKKEQDEGSGGCGKKDAHRRLACVA